MADEYDDDALPSRRRWRLIPLTVTMMSLLLLIKANDLYINSQQLRELYSVRDAKASSEKKEEPKEEAKPEGEKKEEAKAEGDKKEEGSEAKKEGGHGGGEKPVEEPRTFGTGKSTLKDIEALKAKNETPRFTQNELDLLQNLSKRRDELDTREKELDIKAKVLEGTEKRISDKMVEMKTMQMQLEKVLAAYNEKQDSQIKSLVKVYENMKPGDAANIFNELDMPILLEVIDKMSERKVAPVLAAMDPKKARDVTQELAEMRRNAAAKTAGQQPSAGKP